MAFFRRRGNCRREEVAPSIADDGDGDSFPPFATFRQQAIEAAKNSPAVVMLAKDLAAAQDAVTSLLLESARGLLSDDRRVCPELEREQRRQGKLERKILVAISVACFLVLERSDNALYLPAQVQRFASESQRWWHAKSSMYGREAINKLLKTIVMSACQAAAAGRRRSVPSGGEFGGGGGGGGAVAPPAVRAVATKRPIIIERAAGAGAITKGARVGYDTTGDGSIDTVIASIGVDTNADGAIDHIQADTNQDGDNDISFQLATCGRDLLQQHMRISVAVAVSSEDIEHLPVGVAMPMVALSSGSVLPEFRSGAEDSSSAGGDFVKGDAVFDVNSGISGTVVKITKTAAGTVVVLIRLRLDGTLRPFKSRALRHDFGDVQVAELVVKGGI